MPIYVYITEPCKRDLQRYNTTEEVYAFAEKVKKDQNTQQFERFPPPYLKKRFGKQGRLIVEECIFEEDVVLCFVRYLVRGDKEYEKFVSDPQGFHKKNAVSRDEILQFIREQRTEDAVSPLPKLTEIEREYLHAVIGHYYAAEDGVILESYDWYERTSEPWFKYDSYHWEAVSDIVTNPVPDSNVYVHPRDSKIRVMYRYFPEHNKLFLIAPLNPSRPEENLVELEKRYDEFLRGDRLPEEDLLRCSRRAYPSLITLDKDVWANIQKSEVANLALSPEEERILMSILDRKSNRERYPLFINGRAGSGKSTILQYLFAEHLAHHLATEPDRRLAKPPLYLTYSNELLDQAKKAVKSILLCSAKMHLDPRRNLPDLNDETVQKEIDSAFRNFRGFLLELLPAEKRLRFAKSFHVQFSRFKKLWEPRRAKHPDKNVRQISSELAWHAIRTYIKGMRTLDGGEVDPDYYREIPRERKALTTTTFALIYEHVWDKWYRQLCLEEGYWDDQDLVLEVLNSPVDLSQYPAIFCDEAQDFTILEIELLERLSLFSKRQIPLYLAKDIPFAFAGDPFQTVNPTGFNWDAIKASFHDNIARQLDPTGEAKLQFNFQELTLNYRSSEQIVKLCNLIHLLRGVVLGIKELRPQMRWSTQEHVSPFWFRWDDAECRNALREQEELIIIVPCQEGGELEYIEQDPFLNDLALRDGELTKNILSPARAKGLEYNRVVLYGFGDHAIKELPELVERMENLENVAYCEFLQ